MKPIEQARAEMTAAGASAEHKAFMEHAGRILTTAVKFKEQMIARKLATALAKCPKCNENKLHGRLITGRAAGRHQKSGGAFRMWCDNCTDVRMME
jgi:hypothetical protein